MFLRLTRPLLEVKRLFAFLTILSVTFTQVCPAWALREMGADAKGVKAALEEALEKPKVGLEEPPLRNGAGAGGTATLLPAALSVDETVQLLTADPVWVANRSSVTNIPGFAFSQLLDLFKRRREFFLPENEVEWPLVLGRLLAPGNRRAHRVLEEFVEERRKEHGGELPWYCASCAGYASAHHLAPVTDVPNDRRTPLRKLIDSFLIARQAIQKKKIPKSPDGETVHSLADMQEVWSGFVPFHAVRFNGVRPMDQILATLSEVGGWASVVVHRARPDGSTMLHVANIVLDETAPLLHVETADGLGRAVRAWVVDNDEQRSLTDFLRDNTFTGMAVFTAISPKQVEEAAKATGAYRWLTEQELRETEVCCGIIGVLGPADANEVAYVGGHALGYRGPEGFGIGFSTADGWFVGRTPGEVPGLIQAMTAGPAYPETFPKNEQEGITRRQSLAQQEELVSRLVDLSGATPSQVFGYDRYGNPVEPVTITAGSFGTSYAATPYPMTLEAVLGSETQQTDTDSFLTQVQTQQALSYETVRDILWKKFQVHLKKTMPMVDEDVVGFGAQQAEARTRIAAVTAWVAQPAQSFAASTPTTAVSTPVSVSAAGPLAGPGATSVTLPAAPVVPAAAPRAKTLEELRRHYAASDVQFANDVNPAKISLNATFDKGVKVSGKEAEIADGVKVGSFSLIDDSQLAENGVIGERVEITKGSRIGKGTTVQDDVKIEESILGENVIVYGSNAEYKVIDRQKFVPTVLKHSQMDAGSHLGASSSIDNSHIPAQVDVAHGSVLHSILLLEPPALQREQAKGGLVRLDQMNLSGQRKEADRILSDATAVRAKGTSEEQERLRGVLIRDNADVRKISTKVEFLVAPGGRTVLEGEETAIQDGVRLGNGVRITSSAVSRMTFLADDSLIKYSDIGENNTIALGAPVLEQGKERYLLENVKTGRDVIVARSTVKNYLLEDGVQVREDSTLIASDAPAFGMRDGKRAPVQITIGPEWSGHTRVLNPFMPTLAAPYIVDGQDRPVELTFDQIARLLLFTQDNGQYQGLWRGYAAQYENILQGKAQTKTRVHKSNVAMGRVGVDTQITHGEILDGLIGSSAVIDGSEGIVYITRATIDSSPERQTHLESGARVRESFMHAGSSARDGATLEQSIAFEFSAFGHNAQVKQSVIGAVSEIDHVQVEHSLLGPFSVAHHPGGIILSTVAPRGKMNFSHGASIGSNHDALRSRWENLANEGIFYGLQTGAKFPMNFSQAPFGVIGMEVTVTPQALGHPFWMMVEPSEGTGGLNEIRPGALLWKAFMAITLRNDMKYRQRAAEAGESQNLRPIEMHTFRPDVMLCCMKSMEELSQAPRDIRGKQEAIRKAVEAGDVSAAFREILSVLAARQGIAGLKPLEKLTEAGQETAKRLDGLNRVIQEGNVKQVLDITWDLLQDSRIGLVFHEPQLRVLRSFRANVVQAESQWKTVAGSKNAEPLLETVRWKEWYHGSPTDDEDPGKGAYFDYAGLGNNAMSESSRRSALAHYSRYLQWYFLRVLLQRLEAIRQTEAVNGWERIHEALARPFFVGEQKLVTDTVEAQRQWKFKDADDRKTQLRKIWNRLPESDRRLGIPEGTSDENALDLAIEWDWVLDRFGDVFAQPLAENWNSQVQESVGMSAADFAAQVLHRIDGWEPGDLDRHLNLLKALSLLMEQEMAYGATERGMQEAQRIIPDFREVLVRAGDTEEMKQLLENFLVLFENTNGLNGNASVRAMDPEARQRLREEVWFRLSQIKDSRGQAAMLEVPSDYSSDATRYAFQVLGENVLTMFEPAKLYGVDYEPQLLGIYSRRTQGTQAHPHPRIMWNEEFRLNQAGHVFASVVEFLYGRSFEQGLIPPEVFERLQRNDYEYFYERGLLPKALVEDYRTGRQKPDLMGSFTPLTAHLSRRFRLSHARWAVYGIAIEPNTHPFMSSNQVWLGAQNGVLDGSLYDRKLNEQRDQGLLPRSTNDAEVIVNEVQAVMDRHQKGTVSAVSPNERAHWEMIAQEVLKVKRDQVRAQGLGDGALDEFMGRYAGSLAFQDEVATWVAMTNLATGPSEFAVAIRSRLSPQTVRYVSFNRSFRLMWRKETDDVVGVSDENAGIGLWPPAMRDKFARELQEINRLVNEASSGEWTDAHAARVDALEDVQPSNRIEMKGALSELAQRQRELSQQVPQYRSDTLEKLRAELPNAGSQSSEISRQIAAIEAYQEADARVSDSDTGVQTRVIRQVLQEPFGYEAVELQSLPSEDPVTKEPTGGVANFVNVEPVFDPEKGNFRLKITVFQAAVQSDKESTTLDSIRRVDWVDEEDPNVPEGDPRPIHTQGFLNPAQAGKGEFETFAELHISQIDDTYRAKLKEYERKGRLPGWNLEALQQRFGGATLPNLKRIYLLGEGSSYYVGTTAKAWLQELLPGVEIIVKRPPEALYLMGEKETGEEVLTINPEEDLVFLLSWSAETASLEKTRQQLTRQQTTGGGVVSALMKWFGGKVQGLLARIGRRSAGATQTDRPQDGPEVTIFTTRGKANMDFGVALSALDLARLRDPSRDSKQDEKDLGRLVDAVSSLLDDKSNRETAVPWEKELRRTAELNQDYNKVAVIGNTPARDEGDLKMEEGINIFGTQFPTADHGFWTALIPETFRDEKGVLITSIHQRTMPIFISTRGGAQNPAAARREWNWLQKMARLGVSFTVLVAEDHPFRSQIKALQDSVPAQVRVQYPRIADRDLPVVRVHTVPRVRPSLQPMVDQLFFFKLTPYQARKHGLSPVEVDKSRWLAKSVTIAGVAVLKAIMKGISTTLVRLKEFVGMGSDQISDSYKDFAVGQGAAVAKEKPGTLEASVAWENAALAQLPLQYDRLLKSVLGPAGFQGVDVHLLQRRFGQNLDDLQHFQVITDGMNMPAALASEIPTVSLLGRDVSISELSEPLPIFRGRAEKTLALLLVENGWDGAVEEKVEQLRKQGVAVLAITPDEGVAGLTAPRKEELPCCLGSVQAAAPILRALRHQPTLAGATDLVVKALLAQLGALMGGQAAEKTRELPDALRRIPAAATRPLQDTGRRSATVRQIGAFKDLTMKDRRTGKEKPFRKYDKVFVIGGRAGFATAMALRGSLLHRGIMTDVHYVDSAKHGPLAAAPDVFIIIDATDPRTMTSALSDAQTYSGRGADVIILVQEGYQNYPGILSSNIKGVITVPATPDLIGLPVNVAVGETVAIAYGQAFGRNRQQMESAMELYHLREDTAPSQRLLLTPDVANRLVNLFVTSIEALPERAQVEGVQGEVFPRLDVRKMLLALYGKTLKTGRVAIHAVHSGRPKGQGSYPTMLALTSPIDEESRDRFETLLKGLTGPLGANLDSFQRVSFEGQYIYLVGISLTIGELIEWQGTTDKGALSELRSLMRAQPVGLEEPVDVLRKNVLQLAEIHLQQDYISALSRIPRSFPPTVGNVLLSIADIDTLMTELASGDRAQIEIARDQLQNALSLTSLTAEMYPLPDDPIRRFLDGLSEAVEPVHEAAEELFEALQVQEKIAPISRPPLDSVVLEQIKRDLQFSLEEKLRRQPETIHWAYRYDERVGTVILVAGPMDTAALFEQIYGPLHERRISIRKHEDLTDHGDIDYELVQRSPEDPVFGEALTAIQRNVDRANAERATQGNIPSPNGGEPTGGGLEEIPLFPVSKADLRGIPDALAQLRKGLQQFREATVESSVYGLIFADPAGLAIGVTLSSVKADGKPLARRYVAANKDQEQTLIDLGVASEEIVSASKFDGEVARAIEVARLELEAGGAVALKPIRGMTAVFGQLLEQIHSLELLLTPRNYSAESAARIAQRIYDLFV